MVADISFSSFGVHMMQRGSRSHDGWDVMAKAIYWTVGAYPSKDGVNFRLAVLWAWVLR